MFSDIGALELVTLVVLAVLVFGPDKLPKVIQDVSRFVKKIRDFSDSAKEDIRSELGPDFKDFEFEDLNPKTFLRKQMEQNEDLQEFKELRGSFDLKKEMNDVADAVHGREPQASAVNGSAAAGAVTSANGTPDLLKKQDKPGTDERPPYDSDAT
ncbi:sec-independent translocase [Streptomyces sp. NPDC001809]